MNASYPHNWTPEQLVWLKKYLKPQIDRVWNYWPPRLEARKLARGSRWDSQICAACKKEFLRKETEVDHIDPTVDTLKGFEDPLQYIVRKLVQVEELQVLCIPEHRKKSAAENKIRREVKKAKAVIKKRRKRL